MFLMVYLTKNEEEITKVMKMLPLKAQDTCGTADFETPLPDRSLRMIAQTKRLILKYEMFCENERCGNKIPKTTCWILDKIFWK